MNEMRVATLNVTTLYRAGSMNWLVEEIDKYKTEQDDQTTDGGMTVINKCIIKTGKKGEKTELTGRSPLKRRTSALGCRRIRRRRRNA
jgi:hypothetical protein